MIAHASFSPSIWEWPRWRCLDVTTRLLWLGLYTSIHAKRIVPGLWHGSIGMMAEATGIDGDACVTAIDKLIDHRLAEFDREMRVLRMTELPDTCEYPSNAKWVKGWWNRFRLVPACPIRDAHVKTLRWIIDEGARVRGKMVSDDMNAAWLETFGVIEAPEERLRGVRSIASDCDTSTPVQPSLFALRVSADTSSAAHDACASTDPTCNLPSDSAPKSKKSSGLAMGIDTHRPWVSIPSGSGSGSSLSSSGSGWGGSGGEAALSALRTLAELAPELVNGMATALPADQPRWAAFCAFVGSMVDPNVEIAVVGRFLASGKEPAMHLTAEFLGDRKALDALLVRATAWQWLEDSKYQGAKACAAAVGCGLAAASDAIEPDVALPGASVH